MSDNVKLVAWLRSRAKQHANVIVQAVYLGLAARVQRGDFDQEED